MIREFMTKMPLISSTVFIADSAEIIGDVQIGSSQVYGSMRSSGETWER